MDNFNNENNDVISEIPNTSPASVLDGDEATAEQPAISGEPPVESGFKLVQDASPSEVPQSQPTSGAFQPFAPQGQPMGGMNQPPQFGQPMGGMNQPPQFGQPMGGMNQPLQGGKPPKVKKPLSKGAIGGIIGGGVALIALIVCAIIFLPKLFPSDKEVIVDAFEATFGLESDSKSEDILGSQQIADKFATTGGHREYYLELTEASSGEKITMDMSEAIDVENKIANTNFNMGMNDASVIAFNMIVDEELTYFQLPDMINGYFTLPSDNTFQALENSEFGQVMQITGMPEMNMGDLYFNLAASNTTTQINGEYVAIMEELWDSITYEKQGKAKIDVNGKTVTAKEYYITLPQESAKKAIGDLWDASVAELAADPAYLEQMGMDAATFEATMGSYGNMLKGLISGDLVIKVYIADDKVVKIACADDITLYGAEITYDMFIDIDDEKASGVFDFSVMGESVGLKFEVNELDKNPNGKISIYGAGEFIDVNFKVENNSTDSLESCDVYFDVVYNGTTYVKVDSKVNYDKKANMFEGLVDANVMDEGTVSFTYSGEVKDIEKGVGYTVVLKESTLAVDDEPMFVVAGSLKLDTSDHSAPGIDSSLPVYDITTLTESDFTDIISLEENAALLESWAELNSEVFGMDYEEPDVEITEPELPVSADDMILDATNKSVEILGTIDGFAFSMSSDTYVYFETEEWSYIEYSIYEGMTPEEIVSDIYVPSEDVVAQEMCQTMDLNGETIYYSYVQDNEFGYPYSGYCFAKDLGDGVVLVVDAGIYDEDDSYTKEQLVQALDTQYYTIVQ